MENSQTFRWLAPVLMLFVPLLAFGQGQVPAYFFADSTAPIAARLAPNSVALGDAVPVEGLEGWESIEYEATFEGFVDPLAVRADNTVAPATLIYSSDAPDSTVLAASDPSVAVEVIDRGPLWSQIRTTQRVTLFVPVGGVAAAAGTSSAGAAPASTPQPAGDLAPVEGTGPGFDEPTPLDGRGVNVAIEDGPVSPTGDLQPVDGTPGGAPPAPTPVIVDDEPETEPQVQPTQTTVRPTAPNATLSRPFYGVLKKRTGLFRRSKGPKYGLYAPEGELLARVDLSTALVFGSIDSYLNRAVVIQGIPEPQSGRPGVIIRARTLHLN